MFCSRLYVCVHYTNRYDIRNYDLYIWGKYVLLVCWFMWFVLRVCHDCVSVCYKEHTNGTRYQRNTVARAI